MPFFQALPSGILTDYWSKTGVPTLVVERLQAGGKMPEDLAEVRTTPGDLEAYKGGRRPVTLIHRHQLLLNQNYHSESSILHSQFST